MNEGKSVSELSHSTFDNESRDGSVKSFASTINSKMSGR